MPNADIVCMRILIYKKYPVVLAKSRRKEFSLKVQLARLVCAILVYLMKWSKFDVAVFIQWKRMAVIIT